MGRGGRHISGKDPGRADFCFKCSNPYDGKDVVLSLLRARQGSSGRAIASYIICFLLFVIYFFSGEGFREGRPSNVGARREKGRFFKTTSCSIIGPIIFDHVLQM